MSSHRVLGITEIVCAIFSHLSAHELTYVARVSVAFSACAQVVLYRDLRITWDMWTYYFLRRTVNDNPRLFKRICFADIAIPRVPYRDYDQKVGLASEELTKFGKRKAYTDWSLAKEIMEEFDPDPLDRDVNFLSKEEYICLLYEEEAPLVGTARSSHEHRVGKIRGRSYVNLFRFLAQAPNLVELRISCNMPEIPPETIINEMENGENWSGQTLTTGFRKLRSFTYIDETPANHFILIFAGLSHPPRLTTISLRAEYLAYLPSQMLKETSHYNYTLPPQAICLRAIQKVLQDHACILPNLENFSIGPGLCWAIDLHETENYTRPRSSSVNFTFGHITSLAICMGIFSEYKQAIELLYNSPEVKHLSIDMDADYTYDDDDDDDDGEDKDAEMARRLGDAVDMSLYIFAELVQWTQQRTQVKSIRVKVINVGEDDPAWAPLLQYSARENYCRVGYMNAVVFSWNRD